jgi:hypothetical protein
MFNQNQILMKKGKMKIDTAQLKKDGVDLAATVGGVMLGNVANKLIPIENQLVKNAIPLAVGAGGMLAGNAMKNGMVKNLGIGMAAYGLLATVRTLTTGSNMPGPGVEGIAGIGDNPMVRKVVDLLIPNLGEVTEQSFSYSQAPYEGHYEVEDANAEVLSGFIGNAVEEPLSVNPFLDGITEDGSVFLNGTL